MKILKIELQNINSLKSDIPFVIDFESDTFRDVGLFVITGSTGAGKTTILDAITIALYNRIPRFNKSNIRGGLEDVVSYGADKAMARVTFENKGERYEAQWNIRLASKTGKRLGNPREDVRLKNLSSEKIIAEKKREVQTEIERITQLNYHQFLRSVLLAQGEFAAFLSANAKDKGTLLEQITGEEIYKKIGEAINEKIYEERRVLDKIMSKINTEDLLPDEQRKELKKEKTALSLKNKTVDKELKRIERIINWFKRNDELEREQLTLENEQRNLEKDIVENRHFIEVLELHEKAEPYKESVTEIGRIEKENNKINERLSKLKQEFKAILTDLSESRREEKNSKEIHSNKESELKHWLPRLEQVTKLDADIKNHRNSERKTNNTINELSDTIVRIQTNIKQKEQDNKQKETSLKEIKIYLDENKNVPEIEKRLTGWSSLLTLWKNNRHRISEETISVEKNEKELRENNKKLKKTDQTFKEEKVRLIKLKDGLKALSKLLVSLDLGKLLQNQKQLEAGKTKLNELQKHSINYNDFSRKKNELEAEKKVLEKRNKELEKNISSLQSEIVAAEKSYQDAETILEQERAIKNFEEDRGKLEKGKPCNLCGSTVHPYVYQYENIELSKTQKEVKRRKGLLEELKKKEKGAAIESAEVKTKLGAIISQEKNIKQAILETLEKFNRVDSEFKIDDADSLINESAAVEEELDLLSKKITKTQKLLEQREDDNQLYSLEREKVNKLENEMIALQEKSKGISTTMLHKKKDLQTINHDTNEIEISLVQKLSEFGLTIPATESTGDFIAQLEHKILSFDDKKTELSEVKNAISQIISDIKNSEKQLKEKGEEKDKHDKEIGELIKKLSQLSEKRNSILPLGITTETRRNELQQSVITSKVALDKVTRRLNDLKTNKATKEKEKENLKEEYKNKLEALYSNNLALNEKIKSSVFNSRIEIEEALLKSDEKKEYSAIRKKLENEAVKLKTIGAGLKKDFIKQEKEKNFEISNEQAREQYKEIELSKEQLLKHIGAIKKQFELDDQIKARNKTVIKEISVQEKVVGKWIDLNNLLGGSKHAFNTYVQRLTLQNLIQLANIHLFKLNRRYSLKMNETYRSGEELNFNLIDHYQTDQARLVDTSSGGEKFIISLALALGLSDLASNNVNIESLFIDEGFGSLDTNTLETVISTLETLQAQGKMIGLISHVENLKERIPVQIQVLKKRNGVSEVEII